MLNGKDETRKSGILFILRILKEIKIKSPVSEELFKSEISGKGMKPVRVKVYRKTETPEKLSGLQNTFKHLWKYNEDEGIIKTFHYLCAGF